MDKTSLRQWALKNPFGKGLYSIYHHCFSLPYFKVQSNKYYKIQDQIKRPHFLSYDETFDLLKKGYSFSRFGDGEIEWIYGISKGYFGQPNSEELASDLRRVITSEESLLLIGIPSYFSDMNSFDKDTILARNFHLYKDYKLWNAVIDEDKTYADSLMTRCYIERTSEWRKNSHIFEKWKSIWENKDVVIIEGSETRFGVGNDLLKGAKNVKRVICPAENAYSKYHFIIEEILKLGHDSLLLLALGPTASVLSYDLCKAGFQAIDIGHLDVEYEWFLQGTTKKTPLKGKYVNESGGAYREDFSPDVLDKYNHEIITRIM